MKRTEGHGKETCQEIRTQDENLASSKLPNNPHDRTEAEPPKYPPSRLIGGTTFKVNAVYAEQLIKMILLHSHAYRDTERGEDYRTCAANIALATFTGKKGKSAWIALSAKEKEMSWEVLEYALEGRSDRRKQALEKAFRGLLPRGYLAKKRREREEKKQSLERQSLPKRQGRPPKARE